MTDEVKQALRVVIDYLDGLMEENPSQALANASNFLEGMYQNEQ